MGLQLNSRKPADRRTRCLERILATLACINLALVFFNLSYIPYRDFYFNTIPGITHLYDPIKGIQPSPETTTYLDRVETLNTQVVSTGLESAAVEPLLAELRQLSQQMIEENPFAGVDKSHTLEKIKNEMRLRTGTATARDAFATFWGQPYLTRTDWQSEISFWNNQIRPLIATNYYRQVDRFGHTVDYFWLLDLPFVLIFAADLLVRSSLIKRRHPQLGWSKALLRRWYDFLLLLPFWRWLRIIPVGFRLYQAELLDLEPIRAEAQRNLVIGFAVELTEMVGIQVIDQMQAAIRRGELVYSLLHPELNQDYVQVNHRDEATAIATRLVNVSVYEVLPQIQSDIEDLFQHSVASSLKQLPGYQQLQKLPYLDQLPTQMAQNIAKFLPEFAYKTLTRTLEDPVGAEITARLGRNFRDAFESELFKKHNIEEIRSLLIDLLEEILIRKNQNLGSLLSHFG